MASTEISPTLLQVSSSSCENCAGLEQIGQKPSVNGSFFAHLKSSLKQISELDGGEQLPEGGNILPQVLFSSLGQANQLESQPLVNNIFENKIATYTLKDNDQLAIHFDLEEVQDELKPLSDAITSAINNLEPTQDDVTTLSNTKVELTERFDALLTNADQSGFVKLVQSPSITSATKIKHVTSPHALYEQPRIFTSDAPASEDLVEALFNTQNKQHTSAHHNIENLDRSIKKYNLDYLIDDNSNVEIRNLKQTADVELFKQILSANRSDPNLQTTNPVSIHDSAQRLNIGTILNYTVDTPIPLNLNQSTNANLEVVAQSTDQSLFQNIKWLIGNKIQNANINVYPESLGHVNVSLNLEDSKLTINFLANSTVSKEAIEANLPSLREQLNNSGINLQDVNVGSRFSNHAEDHSQYPEGENISSNNQYSESLSLNDENDSVLSNIQKEIQSALYLIDAYA